MLFYLMAVGLKAILKSHFIILIRFFKIQEWILHKNKRELTMKKINKLDFIELPLINYTMHQLARVAITK